MAASCRIPVGMKNGKQCVAVVLDRSGIWSRIVEHAKTKGAFTSPDHLRQLFPDAQFKVHQQPAA